MVKAKQIFVANLEQVGEILQWVREVLAKILTPKALKQIELASEEILVNIIIHAYAKVPNPIEIEVTVGPKQVSLLFRDFGPPFNPLKIKASKAAAKLEEVPVGGLGIQLVRKLVDEVHYQREAHANELALIKVHSS